MNYVQLREFRQSWSVRLDGNANRFSGQVIQKGVVQDGDANLFSVRFATELCTPSRMALRTIFRSKNLALG